MKTNFLLLNVILVLGLSGCGAVWENYAKRSELTIGYSANNTGERDSKGERAWKADGVIRGSNAAISKIFKDITEFSTKELGLK